MATKTKVAQLEQGAVHNAAEPANNVAKPWRRRSTVSLTFAAATSLTFTRVKKIHQSKFSPDKKIHRLIFAT